MASLLGSILAILVCGGIGGVVGWYVVTSLGWTGTGGAIVAAIVAMVIAVALFAAGSTLLRRRDGTP